MPPGHQGSQESRSDETIATTLATRSDHSPSDSPATADSAWAGSSSSMSRGAGLGLSIVRSVAQAHGGRIEASARDDGGLIAEVRIPLSKSETVSRERAPGAARS
ncbi:MAG TPA: sensor histidine kinase [Candidatus Dormibacteraeota bacterium]|nr:sensor histidine kinase [Candidatus Dormibacteraeota bacterium]